MESLLRGWFHPLHERDPPISTYDDLSSVYEQLTPEGLRTPEGNVAAFAAFIDPLPEGARVLDAACGIGLLATGLALRGLRTEATDASPGMVARTRATAARHGAEVRAGVCAWEELPPGPRFDAVFCVGNSIGHARERRRAIVALASTLKPGGVLVLTTRNWERVRALGSHTDGTHTWEVPEAWDAPHHVTVTVGDVCERLTYWPFTHQQLGEDLAAAGLAVREDTYTAEQDRYLVAGTGYPRD
ncbi:class I SAM-dependent methyltransferase [Solirubrobacter sp. CPCC 204708]|uniref:Class I SAM-dependent methyltransferase n=1 Tax=Solirubrobacter deserti TaxID=2282478 RepID=A0ABT4RHI7_9ACTN|nr:class I SAM-dependent methyltransferase [Solirubrobacter deserti]MBE2316479.1 class I SAM-dependent methyltransferase [Solirubrobacter deserti]MDA0138012.1 class I SAM-dependent methyltransferase [Solirubrobacter deserti]